MEIIVHSHFRESLHSLHPRISHPSIHTAPVRSNPIYRRSLRGIDPISPGPKGFPSGSDSKESACNAGDLGSVPGSGRSPGERNGNPLQYSCLKNPMDRGAWWATVYGVAKSWTQLSYKCFSLTMYTFLYTFNSCGYIISS